MKGKVDRLLAQGAPLKAREIAKELGLDRSEVNAFLYKHSEHYSKDDEHRWSLAEKQQLDITLPTGWVDAAAFEDILRATDSIFDGPHSSVRIIFSSKCKTMIDCTARLLALMNQLTYRGKKVTVDFTNAEGTRSYFDRAGFFDLLSDEVVVLPTRPARSAAKRYQGQSDTLVEFGAVDPSSENAELIEQLTDKFVQQSSADYKIAALTVFGELIGNVSEHSESPLHGFAGLQMYGGNHKHIQTVVTDSGVGIANTLRPALRTHYPSLNKKFGAKSLESDMGLVIAVVSKGKVSRFGGARGLGFKSSSEQAIKFNASFSVRQETFCLRFEYRDGQLAEVRKQSQLSKLLGTHICFDFRVD